MGEEVFRILFAQVDIISPLVVTRLCCHNTCYCLTNVIHLASICLHVKHETLANVSCFVLHVTTAVQFLCFVKLCRDL